MNASLKEWQEHLETGIKYLGEGNSVQAEGYLEESLTAAEAIGVPVIIAFSQRLLATTQVRNNKLAEAESGFQRALQVCLKLKNNKGISEAKAGLASISFVRGDYSQAVTLYQQAITVYPEDASPLRLAVLYSDLGQVLARMKKWSKAEKAFLQAGNLCKQYNYIRGEAEISLYLGEVYYSQNKPQKAKENFFRAAKLFGVIGEELSLANSLQYLAFILLDKNKIDEALLLQYRVIALFLRHQQLPEISDSFYLLSSILQYAGLYDEAEKSLAVSLNCYSGYELGYAMRYHSLAVIAVTKKEYDQAKKYYYQALKYFQFYGDGSKIGEISEEITYLIKFEDAIVKENLYKWLGERSPESDVPKHEVMIRLALNLRNKGNNLAALRCGWRAWEIAKAMKYETQEIEGFIQNLSERIRKRNREF